MPTVQVSTDAQTLTIAVTGTASKDDVITAIEENYPTLGGRSTLWDFTQADVSRFARPDFEAIAAVAKTTLPYEANRKTAYVVADHASYVVACKYLNTAFAVSLPAEYRVFTSFSAAQDWIRQK